MHTNSNPIWTPLPQTRYLVADGFSCRTQIEQAAQREAVHLAQVIQMAMAGNKHELSGNGKHVHKSLDRNDGYAREWITAGIVGALFAGTGLLLWPRNRAR